jgi:sodium transport system permease protein
MNARNIGTIYRKELRDMLRDRRTILSMIIIPTFVIPALIIGIGTLSYRVVKQAQATVPSVMILGADHSPKVRAALDAQAKFKVVPTTADWRALISDKKVRAAVEIPAGFDAAIEQGAAAAVKIYNYEGELRSNFAVSEVRRFFTDYRDKFVAARLAERGLPPSFVRPFEIASENVAPPEKVGGNAIGGIIPYLFLILAFTGAMYPAMDLTAGEKERGTMETILCSPIARIDLVLGKFLMVLTASLGTVAFSLTSMSLTLLVGGRLALGGGAAVASAARGAAGGGGALPSFDPLGLIAVVAMVIPMAVLFSAALLAISLFAKSFKEAQSYVSPLVIIIVMPAVMALLPGVELNARLALVPILNVSLVSKELVSGVWHWNFLALIFGSTCVYAGVALALAVRMFNREDVIFRT